MSDKRDRIDQLEERLELLITKHRGFVREIKELRSELYALKEGEDFIRTPEPTQDTPQAAPEFGAGRSQDATAAEAFEKQADIASETPETPEASTWNLEKFVGENLISKIGILITVIGVAIGVKYSIDHDLISPLGRVIAGYLFAIGLLALGIKLKNNYEDYSAVLVSGAMASMYFITYTAYDFYGLMPQLMAFGTMVIFTIFTVFAALQYDRQVIAHIGLVGAYGIPFLLGSSSGRVDIMFAYMALINLGILVIAVRKYWKALFFSAFTVTWFIYSYWFATEFNPYFHLQMGVFFLTLFFLIFYCTFLAYKLLNNENFQWLDVVMLLANSFVFYGFGYYILNIELNKPEVLGLFTLGNAAVHFIVSSLVYQRKLVDRNLFYLVSGLVLIFITIAVPVQLEGSWVSLLWAGEAVLLFWIGRVQGVKVYEWLSYIVVALAFVAIWQPWNSQTYLTYGRFAVTGKTAFFNASFVCGIFASIAFGLMANLQRKFSGSIDEKSMIRTAMGFAIPTIFIVTLYSTFTTEINTFWAELFRGSQVQSISEKGTERMLYNYDYKSFGSLSILCFSLLFASLMAFVNIKKIRSELLAGANLILIVLAIASFFTEGLFALEELRNSYLESTNEDLFSRSIWNLGFRYICYGFVALALYAVHQYRREDFFQGFVSPETSMYIFDGLLYGSFLVLASTELINWMEIAGSSQSFKLALSILWGVFSLFLIVIGIWKSKKHLRIAAIGLFALTLLKLFFYDISHLDTISKTIVFVSLGVLLLVISFLYNKYKDQIFDGED